MRNAHLCHVFLTTTQIHFPMKRIFSNCFLFLALLFPASAWAQDAKIGSQPPSERGGQAAPSPLSLIAPVSPDSTAQVTGIEGAATAAEAGPMFPDSLMKNYDVEVFQSVVKLADQLGYKYTDMLAKAKTGDATAIYQMLDFHRIVEGKDALNHAVTCLEILPLAGDDAFASAVVRCKPKLVQVVLDRLVLAQGRSKKTFLRQGMGAWAPTTWAVLNGQAPPSKTAANTPNQEAPAPSSIPTDATPQKKQ